MKDFKKLIIKNLTKKFGDNTILNNISITLEKGEFLTFLGPSGCGKSTALNCIAGLIPITNGQIYLDDQCIDNGVKKVPAEKREFGMVFQNYALFPHLTVFKNVAFGLELKKMNAKTIKEKVKNALNMVHLDEFENKFPAQMSGGQQQRVAIARCIVMEPTLILLDEPLSNLDAKLRNDMRYEIKELHERLHSTFLYVTHDHQEALALSDRIVVLNGGVIQQIGASQEIYSKPKNVFVADFMGFKNIWKADIKNIKENEDFVEVTVFVDGINIVVLVKNDCENQDKIDKLKSSLKNNKKVTMAIRPEDILIEDGPNNNVECRIELMEYLGQSFNVGARIKDQKKVEIKTPIQSIKEGERVNVYLPSDKIVIFPEEEGAI
jgi:putative spermidine/putrescine transport system ATP-binding protein